MTTMITLDDIDLDTIRNVTKAAFNHWRTLPVGAEYRALAVQIQYAQELIDRIVDAADSSGDDRDGGFDERVEWSTHRDAEIGDGIRANRF